MNLKRGRNGRKGISPILATIVLIAMTLISAISLAGFVFGLFGSLSNSAQILGVGTFMKAADANKATGLASATCSPNPGSDYVAFRNTGTQSATITSFSLTYEGQTFNAATAGGAACDLTAGGPFVYINVVFTGITGLPVNAGAGYVGTISATNNGNSQYSGSFA